MPAELKKLPYQLLVLFVTLALYLISNYFLAGASSPYNLVPLLFGIFVVVELFFFVGAEVKEGAQKHGWKHEIVDTIVALAVAVAIWYGACFILNTSSPLSAVVSCSMLPNLQRGDFVVVQGAPIHAYEIEMTKSEFESITNDAEVFYDNESILVKGSMFSYCVDKKIKGIVSDVCTTFIKTPELFVEKNGPLTYKYARCQMSFSDGSLSYQPCVNSVVFKGQEYFANFSHDTIVYASPENNLYSLIGDIVHRTYFKINVEGETYYVTRGDNNPIFDIQAYDYTTYKMGNLPIREDYVKGKVLGRVPILGYFKVLLSGHIQEDSQCRTQLKFTNVN